MVLRWLKSVLGEGAEGRELSDGDKIDLAVKLAVASYNNQRTFVDNHPVFPKPEQEEWKVMLPLISNYISWIHARSATRLIDWVKTS